MHETADLDAMQLTDFGLSKVGLINGTDDLSGPDVSSILVGDHQPADAEQRAQQRQQRQKQTAVGTPDYLAPEILLGMTHGFYIFCFSASERGIWSEIQ